MASVIAFITGLLSANLPELAPEALEDFSRGLGQILTIVLGMLLSFFYDARATKPAKPEIVKE